MLGLLEIISMDQVYDCLVCNWIVVVVNYCFCFGVDILNGFMCDCCDLFVWVYDGKFVIVLVDVGDQDVRIDYDYIFVMGILVGGYFVFFLVSCMFEFIRFSWYFMQGLN